MPNITRTSPNPDVSAPGWRRPGELDAFEGHTLSFTVWPTHAGAVNADGEEPINDFDYCRGQITWQLNEQGTLVGRAAIRVPPGHKDWTHVIYTHTPATPSYSVAAKFAHPIRLPEGGIIDLTDITESDVTTTFSTLNPDEQRDWQGATRSRGMSVNKKSR